MFVNIHMQSQSRPVEREDVLNAYTKDGLYCLCYEDGIVEKFPMCNIFAIAESEDPLC